jgi:hypothetical protein
MTYLAPPASPATHAAAALARRGPAVQGLWTSIAIALLLCLCCADVSAQDSDAETPDPTRLDVERLPPEAIEVTRDMFAHGLFLQSFLGTRGFFGALGELAQPGLLARVGLGYELLAWLSLGASFELSMHALQAPLPPTRGNFQLIDALAEARLQLPLSARSALWLSGEAGLATTLGNLLVVHGFADADALGLIYGGSLGFDWHTLSRHHSLGLLAGARLHPNLAAAAGQAPLGVHGSAYLKYVF